MIHVSCFEVFKWHGFLTHHSLKCGFTNTLFFPGNIVTLPCFCSTPFAGGAQRHAHGGQLENRQRVHTQQFLDPSEPGACGKMPSCLLLYGKYSLEMLRKVWLVHPYEIRGQTFISRLSHQNYPQRTLSSHGVSHAANTFKECIRH